MPRTKEDIIGWCSNDDEEDPRIENMGYLATEMYNRFKILHCQFLNKGRYEHRNDLMFLLNEMLKRGYIDQKDYEKGVATLDVEFKIEEEGFEQLLHSTLSYLLAYDKEELRGLMKEFKEDGEEENKEEIEKLEKLVYTFFNEDFLHGLYGKPILPMIEEIMSALESSSIAKSSMQRLRSLLNDIKNTRYRVKSVMERVKNANGDDQLHVLQQLAKEELLSDEQFQKMIELEDMTMPAVVDIIKETKTGQGLKFLPRSIVGLSKKLPILIEELVKTGMSRVKRELSGVFEELLRQGGVTLKQYLQIKEDNNIL